MFGLYPSDNDLVENIVNCAYITLVLSVVEGKVLWKPAILLGAFFFFFISMLIIIKNETELYIYKGLKGKAD